MAYWRSLNSDLNSSGTSRNRIPVRAWLGSIARVQHTIPVNPYFRSPTVMLPLTGADEPRALRG